MTIERLGYVNVFVRDFDAAVDFFCNKVGLKPLNQHTEFGYASFETGRASFAVAKTDDDTLVGRHTGVGFIVDDIDATYRSLTEQGVEFEMPPTKQPWGGTLALMKDPEGNVYYLDPGGDE